MITLPLPQGKTSTVMRYDTAPSGTYIEHFILDAETVLISLWVSSLTSGTLTCSVYTQTDDGREVSIIEFPSISSITTELLLRKAAVAMGTIRVVVTLTGAGGFEVRAKGVNAGVASVKIEGANNWTVDQIDVGTSPTSLFPLSLEDRQGLLVKNYDTAATLFLAEAAAKITDGKGYPLGPGESLAMDLSAGQEIYGAASAGTIDVRLVQAGGE